MSGRVQNVGIPTRIWVQPQMRERVGAEELVDLIVVHTHSNRDTGYHYGIVASGDSLYVVSQLVGTEWHLCGAVTQIVDPRDLVRLAVTLLRGSQQQDLPIESSAVLTWLQEHGHECSPIVVRRCLRELEQQRAPA